MVPKKPEAERRVTLSIRVLPNTKARLEAAAKQQELSLTDLHRKWLSEKLTDWEQKQAAGKRQVTPLPKGGRVNQ
jgi:hypothetical protein